MKTALLQVSNSIMIRVVRKRRAFIIRFERGEIMVQETFEKKKGGIQ